MKFTLLFILLILALLIIGGVHYYKSINKISLSVHEPNKITQFVDLGYNLETKKQLWKYPNETEWRNLDNG